MEDMERTEAAELSVEDVLAGMDRQTQEPGGGQDAQQAQEELAAADEANEQAQEEPGAQPGTDHQPEAGAQASDAQVEAVRTLLADGWTREELLAFAQDETAQKDMRGGKSVRQAALAYLRRTGGGGGVPAPAAGRKKSAAPVARNTSAGGTPETDPIKNMTDAQYDRFMEDVRRRAMRGEKIRI